MNDWSNTNGCQDDIIKAQMGRQGSRTRCLRLVDEFMLAFVYLSQLSVTPTEANSDLQLNIKLELARWNKSLKEKSKLARSFRKFLKVRWQKGLWQGWWWVLSAALTRYILDGFSPPRQTNWEASIYFLSRSQQLFLPRYPPFLLIK